MTRSERPLDRGSAASERPRVQFERAVVIGEDPMHARGSEFEQPSNVGGRDEMPRRAHDVRAKNASLVTRTLYLGARRSVRHAKPKRPFRRLVLLCLHRTEPGHNVLRPAKTWRRNVLVSQPTFRDCHRNPHGLPPPTSGAPIEG